MARENFSLGRTHRRFEVYLHLAPLGASFVSFRRLYGHEGEVGIGLCRGC